MACNSCAIRRRKMKQWIAARLGIEWSDANTPANVQATPTPDQTAQAEGGRSPGNTGAEYQQRGVEAVKAAGVGKGRVSVSGVRKAGSGKA